MKVAFFDIGFNFFLKVGLLILLDKGFLDVIEVKLASQKVVILATADELWLKQLLASKVNFKEALTYECFFSLYIAFLFWFFKPFCLTFAALVALNACH